MLRIIRSAYRLRDLVNGICINRRLLCNSIKSRKGVYGSYNTRSNGKKQLFHHGEKASAKVAENESSCKNMTRPTEDTLQNSNDYLRQIDCLGFAGSVVKRNAGCQDPAHCLSGFLSKAGSFLPGFIFSCAPARNRGYVSKSVSFGIIHCLYLVGIWNSSQTIPVPCSSGAPSSRFDSLDTAANSPSTSSSVGMTRRISAAGSGLSVCA